MVTSSATQQHEATSSLCSAGTELPVRLAVKLSDSGPDQAEAKQSKNKNNELKTSQVSRAFAKF